MTYAPASLKTLGAYLVAHDAVNLGIVGDTSHAAKGISYHLGADWLVPTAYSRQTARDIAGLTDAASAIDIGKIDNSFTRLRAFSKWLLARAQANEPGTSDIREIIYSPDGATVYRWDRERGYASAPKTGEADNSHLYNTHISYYRDSENRDKVGLISRFFDGSAASGDDVLDRYVLQHWTANGTDGVLRAKPDRAAPVIARLPAGTDIVSFGEWLDKATGNAWRAAEWPKGSGTIAYFLRYGPGIAKDHDFIAGPFATPGGFTQADLDAATLAARQKQWDLDHQFAVVTLPARPS